MEKYSLNEGLIYPVIEIVYPYVDKNYKWKINKTIDVTDHAMLVEVSDNYILKFLPFAINSHDNILKEMQLHHASAALGIAPEIVSAWFSKNGGIIVMKKLGKDIGSLLTEYESLAVNQLILSNIISIIGKLHLHQIAHGDLHFGNILTVAEGNKSVAVESHPFLPVIGPDKDNRDVELADYLKKGYRYYLIDFGEARKLSGNISEDLPSIKKDYFHFGGGLYDLLNDFYSPSLRNIYETFLIITKQFE